MLRTHAEVLEVHVGAGQAPSLRVLPIDVVYKRGDAEIGGNQNTHQIAGWLNMAPSTVYAVLKRAGLSSLARLDRTTREVIGYEKERPGEMIHLDVKKLRPEAHPGWRRQA